MKYLVLDFGKVLAYPPTGNWFITPKFLELIDLEKINSTILIENINKFKEMVATNLEIRTLEEEFNKFIQFYDSVFKNLNYPSYTKELAKIISYNRVYEFNQYKLYDDVKSELERLSKKYKIILLSDNWPSVINYMDHYGILKLFDRVYVSSIYGQDKKDYKFFDNPIQDYNIKYKEAIFIDDNEKLLDIAKEKGFEVMLMDRDKKMNNSKYNIISSLKEII